MNKAVFFDIDGTLWDSRFEIPESTVRGIQKLHEQGNYAFICTGRSRSAVQSQKLLNLGFDGIVAGCGTYIEYRSEVVFEKWIPYEKLQEVQETLRELHMPVLLEGSEAIYYDEEAFGEEPYLKYLKQALGDTVKTTEHLDIHSKVNKMSALCSKADRTATEQRMKEEWNLVYHSSFVVEIMPRGFSKASGIAWICEYLGIPREDTYGFGDSANDLDMLNYVKYGIAMGNGTEDAKEAADYVTSDIHEDGIYRGLEYFGLI